MKRRLVSLLLAMVMLCTCFLATACAEEGSSGASKPESTPPTTIAEPSAFEVVNAALEKTQALDDFAAELKMEMNMAMEGMTMSIPMSAKIKVKDSDSETPVTSAVISMSMFGETMNIEMYQEGQWAYLVMEDMKYKSNVEELMDEYDYTGDAAAMLQKLPEDLLKDVELVKGEDGSQTVTVSIPAESFAKIYDDFIDDVNDGMELAEMENAKLSDTEVKIVITNDYVTQYDITFSLEMEEEGIKSTTQTKATLVFEDPGAEVTITPPEGYQDFEEMEDIMEDILIEDFE